MSHILNCSEQCIKVLQGDLVFHSLLGKEHAGANWFWGKESMGDSNSSRAALWREGRFSFEATKPRSMLISSPWTTRGETLHLLRTYTHHCCLVTQPCPTLCNSMACSPPGSSVHGDSPGKDTGVGCHALLQGIFPTQGSNPGLCHLLHWQVGS